MNTIGRNDQMSLLKLIKALMSSRHSTEKNLKIIQIWFMHLQRAGRTYPKIFITLFKTQVSLKAQTANQEHLTDEALHEQLVRRGKENLPKQMGRQCVLKIVFHF